MTGVRMTLEERGEMDRRLAAGETFDAVAAAIGSGVILGR